MLDRKSHTSSTMLLILDGFGYTSATYGNALAHAQMPTWHYLTAHYQSTLLHASGEHVGLLPHYIGNSEVGHLTLGAGRVVKSMLKTIHDAIDNKTFFNNNLLISRLKQLKTKNAPLHLMGLLSDGGVHSHEYHLYALLKLAHDLDIKNIFIHVFLDGRDVPPQSARIYLEKLEAFCKNLNSGIIASISGRFYAMDRDKNLERTQQCYTALTQPQETSRYNSWEQALEYYYQQNITDEFIPPTLFNPEYRITHNSGIIFFNFRPDRARQITEFFIGNNTVTPLFFMGLTLYQENFKHTNFSYLFSQEKIPNTLLDFFAQQKDIPRVFSIAETEKYAHVTYFFRGMHDIQLENETRTLIPSIKAQNYINTPEMSAPLITQTLLKHMNSDLADFYLVNFANLDMVGHSGDFQATIKACECIDQQLSILYLNFVKKHKGTIFIVGDHGNAESKIDFSTGKPLTAHTCNPVPFALIGQQTPYTPQAPSWGTPHFGLAHIAPTILQHMNYIIPDEMTAPVTF